MKPISYWLYLKPNLDNWTIESNTKLSFSIDNPSNSIEMHQKNLKILESKIWHKKESIPHTYRIINEEECVKFDLKTQVKGILEIQIKAQGQITDSLMGIYRSHYIQNNQKKYIIVTQFEEREARSVFPCIDDPKYKAPMDIEFEIPAHLQAICNMPIKEEILLSEDREKKRNKLVKFERTPPLCTYVLFFGIGDFEYLEHNKKQPLIRISGPPDRIQYGGFALDVARKSLDEMVNYTKVEFPLPKLDHIAVQDFAFGAMENWGAVTYRENLLLDYPGQTTQANRVRIANVIIHETSHMWFGNLVSPNKWKYIWLNESFATFFTSHITDVIFPKWNAWDDFILSDFLSGLERDSYRKTQPIELEGENEINIDSSTSPIIYSKGGAVLRMIIDYFGDKVFQKTCQKYLEQYKYQSISTQEFWDVFDNLTEAPLKEIADSWIHQGGFPLVKVQLEKKTLSLEQSRFTLITHLEPTLWIIPLKLKYFKNDGSYRESNYLMKEQRVSIKIPDDIDVVLVNSSWTGFYRTQYSKDDLLKIGNLAKQKILNKYERLGLVNDIFALVRKNTISKSDYLDFILDHYNNETHYLPLLNIIQHLLFLIRHFKNLYDRIKMISEKLVALNLNKLGMKSKKNETVHESTLRSELIWLGAKIEKEEIIEWGLKEFNKLLNNKEIDTELKETIMKIGAFKQKNAKDYLFSRYLSPDSTQAEKMKIIKSFIHFSYKDDFKEVLDFSLEKMTRNNAWFPFLSISENPISQDIVWEWFKSNLDTILEKFQMSYLGRVFKSVLYCADVSKKEKNIQFFFNNREKLNKIWNMVDDALESYEIFCQLKNN